MRGAGKGGSVEKLRDTGANLVASTLLTRTYLGGRMEIPRIPGLETTGVHAA